MSRSYKGIRLKKHRVYSVEDLMRSFEASRNTITNWAKSGLDKSDNMRPYRFRGAVVNAFHQGRRERSRSELRPGEFKCFGCKMAVFPEIKTLSQRPSPSGAPFLTATCPDCGAAVHKLGKKADLEAITKCSIPNITGDSAHEENTSVPAGIETSKARYSNPNDRIIYEWQLYAEKFDAKTADRHLTAIRQFETFLDGKPFAAVTVRDCQNYRAELKASLNPDASSPKSKSSVQHVLSHLRDFLKWLRKQEGYKRLPPDMTGALEMPRTVFASAPRRDPKPYPSLQEAEHLLSAMPARTIAQRRGRAIFAIAFLSALRADTIVSLRLEDIDCDQKTITQNGTTSRSKNGKSLVIKWFPIPELFAETVARWVEFMKWAGFDEEDALFPDLGTFTTGGRRTKITGPRVQAMTSTHAVTKAFRSASSGHHDRYTPHAAKHAIAAEMDRRSLTLEERKAWSQNMGHENQQTTERYYGKLDDKRRFELIEGAGEAGATTGSRPLRFDDIPVLVESIVRELK